MKPRRLHNATIFSIFAADTSAIRGEIIPPKRQATQEK